MELSLPSAQDHYTISLRTRFLAPLLRAFLYSIIAKQVMKCITSHHWLSLARGTYSFLVWFALSSLGYSVSSPSTPRPETKKASDTQSVDVTSTDSYVPISPGLRGFGIETVGGSGRHLRKPRGIIMRVTNLFDSGPGSLRACVENRLPRTCVFEVGGEIKLRRALRIRSPFITIAGQTAPEPGITISHGGFRIETNHVFIQHLAIRPGNFRDGVPAEERDGISVGGRPPRSAHHVVLDHLSVTWAIDENISTWHPSTRDVTISNNIIAEGLRNSIHPKGPHSKGVMIGNGSQRITLIRNLIALNEERNPYLKPGTTTEVLNNVVYGWGSGGGWSLCNLTNNDDSDSPVTLSFIGNSYIPGPLSVVTPPVYAKQLSPRSRIFVDDNQTNFPPRKPMSPWGITSLPQYPYQVASPPFRSPGASTVSCEEALPAVLRSAGTRPNHRSPADSRIVTEVNDRIGDLKDCIVGCPRAVGAWPTVRPRRRHLRLPRRPFEDDNRDGYTNLENWLQRLAQRV